MTRQVFHNVEPIWAGYDLSIPLAFAEDLWDEMEMATGRLVAQFRKSIDGAVLFTADTDSGSITRTGEHGLTIAIPAASSATFDKQAIFDFVRIDAGEKRVIPGRWQWPVLKPVTRDAG